MQKHGPGEPGIEWFLSGEMDRRKFDEYLLSPTHPDGRNKLALWRRTFGIVETDGELLQRLIREHLPQATITEQQVKAAREDASRVFRRWELLIPRFTGPNGNTAPVLTG